MGVTSAVDGQKPVYNPEDFRQLDDKSPCDPKGAMGKFCGTTDSPAPKESSVSENPAVRGSTDLQQSTEYGPQLPTALGSNAKIESEIVAFSANNAGLLSNIEGVLGIPADSAVRNAKFEAIKLGISSLNQEAYMKGSLDKFVELMDARNKGDKTDMSTINKSIIDAGKIAVNLAKMSIIAKTTTGQVAAAAAGLVALTKDPIGFYIAKNSENYKKLSNICALADINPKEVLKNAVKASDEYVTLKDNAANTQYKKIYVKNYVEAFLNRASNGQIPKELMIYNKPELLLDTKKLMDKGF